MTRPGDFTQDGSPPLPVPAVDIHTVDDGQTPNGSSSSGPSTAQEPQVVRIESAYLLEEALGRGGMGDVILGRDLALNRQVAVKILKSEHGQREGLVGRFVEEAQVASQLQHPGVPPVHVLGSLSDGRPCFAMKLVKGQTLAVLLKERPSPTHELSRFLTIFEQVCQAVAYAHSKRVIHRDLKPANVMVGAFGEVQVMDWGMAKILPEWAANANEDEHTVSVIETDRMQIPDGHTRAGSMLGTPAYMPPEQARGELERVDRRSDVFGLGAILCQVLTGQPPYSGGDLIEKAQRGLLVPALERLEGCGADTELVSLAKACLRVQPEERPQDAAAVAQAVAAYQSGVQERLRQAEMERAVAGVRAEEARARATAQAERRARRLALALVAVLILGMVVTGYFLVESTTAHQTAVVLAEKEAEARGEADEQKQRAEKEWRRAEGLAYAGQISLALAAWNDNDARLAWHHLESARKEYRHWEYRYLHSLFNRNQRTFRGHTGAVFCVAWSPDGKRIVSGSYDRTLKIWAVDKGQQLLSLDGHPGPVSSVTWSPDGKRIASGSNNGSLKIWDAEKGKEIHSLKGHTHYIYGVAWSPDGKRIVSGSGDGTLKIWDIDRGQEISSLKGHTGFVTCVAWSPDGKRIVSGSGEPSRPAKPGGLKIWDADKGQEILSLEIHTDYVSSVAWSPDSKRIVSGSWDNTLKIWDAEKGQEIHALVGHTFSVKGVAWSPDGKRIVSGTWDNPLKIWDAEKGREIHSLKGHLGGILCVAWSPDGKRVVSGSTDNMLNIWEADRGQDVRTLEGHTDPLTTVAWSPDGKRIVSGSTDNRVKIWAADTAREMLSLVGHTFSVTSVAWSPDGKRIVSGGGDQTNPGNPGKPGEVKIWDADRGREILSLKGHTHAVRCVAWSPNGKRIVSGSLDNTLVIWDADRGQKILTLEGHTSGVHCVAWSPDGKRIVSGSHDETLKVWDAEKGQAIHTLEGHTWKVTCVAWSPDGKRIVSGSYDNLLEIWDADTGQEILSLKGHTLPVFCVAWSPDGKRIVSGSGDNRVKIWDAATGQENLSLKGQPNGINCVAWSPDGNSIVGGSWDRTVKIWDVETRHQNAVPR